MLSILDQQMISEYNVFKELIQSYNKQIVMEEYIQEDGEKKSVLSGIKAGGAKLGKGILNLLKKGWDLFNKFLDGLKKIFQNIKAKFNKPWYTVKGCAIKIDDRKVLELIKYKFPNLIFNDNGVFIQTTGARSMDKLCPLLINMYKTISSDKYRNTIKRFDDELTDNNHDKPITDNLLDNVDSLTKSNKLINDDLNKILKEIKDQPKVDTIDINKNNLNQTYNSIVTYLSLLIDRYDTFENFFNKAINYFDDIINDKYKKYQNIDKALQKNYSKALQVTVDNLGTIVDNLKLLFELSDEYNFNEVGNFKTFLYNGADKDFKRDYKDYRSEKARERHEKAKENLNNKLDGMKSKFKRKKKENKEENNNDNE